MTTAYEPRHQRRPWWVWSIPAALALVIVVLLGSGLWALRLYRIAKGALPTLDGTIPVQGLSSEVSVVRDHQGVPHITAPDLDSLFFAQGYVTAQDRLWQMDTLRRAAAGELSEVLGDALLEHDRQQRILQLRHTAEIALPLLPARERGFVDDYARGVNAFIDSHRSNLPIEFRILKYQPKNWTALDSVLAGVNMNQTLNTQYDTELIREKIVAKLSSEMAADLYPNGSWRDHPPGGESDVADKKDVSLNASMKKVLSETDRGERDHGVDGNGVIPDSHSCEACLPGSNNWVVSGARTASGKPLLSNDMHLEMQIPSLWYEAHLRIRAGSYDVAGVTLPGVPFVIVGHNQRIAWGFTNLGPDVQDLYVETLNAHDQYQTPHGWAAVEHRKEIIKIKGRQDQVLDVSVTRHGPIITPIVPGETRSIALKWTLYDTSLFSIPFFNVNSAANWDEFRAAFSTFSGPGQNVVYGDVDGHIGYQATGKIPIRAAGDGLSPVSGADDAHEWTGYVPFSEMPSVYDPPGGVIATANSRVTPDHYKYMISNQWLAPYRTQRIYALLDAGHPLTREDMLAIQTDVFSDVERFFANQFVYAIDHTPKASNRARKAADLMRGWNGELSMDSPAATIRAYARVHLWELLLKPHIGEEWKEYRWFSSTVALENLVSKQPPRWLPPGYANWNELLTAAVEQAIQQHGAPSDLTQWKYGDAFPVELRHPILSRIPIVRGWSGPGVLPQSGGGTTVKQVGRTFGPSERLTVDFSDLDHSTLNIVAGQSGQLFSPHYLDHWPAWYHGTTFTLPYSQEAIAKEKEHSLQLVPAH